MTSETRRELLRVLDELSAQCPDVRFGQFLANLATLAKGPSVEAIWDAEDEELRRAAQKQLALFCARSAAVLPSGTVQADDVSKTDDEEIGDKEE